VYQVDEEGVRHELPGLSKGDYFGGKYIDPTCINMLSAQSMQDGKRWHTNTHRVYRPTELALLNDKPRAATIYAKGRLKCATLNKRAFNRLLGPVVDIIKRNTVQYKRSSKIAL
jgi:hypothetical protein